MNKTRFILVGATLAVLGFLCGQHFNPVRHRGEPTGVPLSELAQMQKHLDFVRLLDDGNVALTRSLLNAEIDLWIVNRNADARKGPWIEPDTVPSPETAFLARVARQRELHPVTHDSSEVADLITETLSAALAVERNKE